MSEDRHDTDPTGRFWGREDGGGSWSGNMARAAAFNRDFAGLTERGTVDIGPIPAELVAEQWQGAVAAGVSLERLSAFLVTAEGRSVYLLGPHTPEGPRGLELRDGRVQVISTDEAGVVVHLELPSALLEAFVVIGAQQG